MAGAVVIVASFALPASASAAQTIGPPDFLASAKCTTPNRTYYGQKSTGADPYVVPSKGVITGWTFRTGTIGLDAVKLKVGFNVTNRIIRTDAESAPVALAAKTTTLNPTRIPVVAGQRIGFYAATDDMGQCFSSFGGIDDSIITETQPYDQTPGMSASYLSVGSWAFPLTAVLEADVDGDGFGDETQDPCPGVAGPSGCPLPLSPTTPGTTVPAAPAAPAPDVTAPVISPLSLSRSSFKASGSTQVSYVLSEAGTVVLTVERKGPGRRVEGACKPPTRKNRGEKSCDRWLKVGFFATPGNAGPNIFVLPGRVGGKALMPGAYRVTAAATDGAKNGSTLSRSRFSIVK